VYIGTPGEFFADPCDFINNHPIIAEGQANFIYEDNELQGFLQGGTNSFGWMSEGNIEDVINGGTVHYSMHRRVLIKPDFEIVTTVSIGPTLR
jgi:hypothetical protein